MKLTQLVQKVFKCTAENLRSDASRRSALRLKLAEKIESIIRESVKPMANIGDIKIVDVNGLAWF